ncbi:MAG: YXWGXW repeat-containing protein, partial [Terracidiphilus sp.]
AGTKSTRPAEETMKHRMFLLAVAALIASGSAFAQESQPTQPTPQSQPNQPAPTVNQRRENQQDRIANGVGSGQLTAGETKNLESREANVNREVRDDRQANGGKLTQQERQQVNRQQNNVSHSIYQDKHNGNAAHYGNNEVGQRRENQQDRIANGIRNGSMNAGEAARVENHEQGINQQVRADRQANSGRLTGQQHRQINREQNRTSRQIYRDKHNGK